MSLKESSQHNKKRVETRMRENESTGEVKGQMRRVQGQMRRVKGQMRRVKGQMRRVKG